MTVYKQFFDSGIEYTYFISQGSVYLGTNSNTQSAIDRSTTGTLYIPSKLRSDGNELSIIGLSTYSFYAVNLTTIVLPKSITKIRGSAFEGMKNLVCLDM